MKNRRTAFIALLLVPLVALRAAELKLPSIFSDHEVLQSEKPLPAWGWVDAGERVTVKFAGQSKTAAAGADGKWLVKLDALEASADLRELVVKSLTQNRAGFGMLGASGKARRSISICEGHEGPI